jgi:hypothetical protein
MTGALALLLGQPEKSTAQDGGESGYGGGFYIRDAEGNYELRLSTAFQARYLYTLRSEGQSLDSDEDLDIGGFQLRRVQLDFQGNFFNPRWTYRFRLDSGNGGALSAAHLWIAHTTEDGLATVRFGQFKPDFLQEETIGEPAQQAIERDYTTEYFTVDYARGVQLVGRPSDRVTLVGSLHSGSYSFRSDYTAAPTEIGFAARAAWIPFAEAPARAWGQFGDFQHWEGDQNAALIGVGVDYELGRSGESDYPDVLKWTVDASVEAGGASLFGAVIGQSFTADSPLANGVPASIDGVSQIGFVGQGAWFLLPNSLDAFVRFESIDFDGVYYRLNQGSIQSGSRDLEESRLSILTAGVNHYLRRNNARLTFDVVHAFDPVPVADSGNALLRSIAGGQTAIRTQMQLRF